MDQTDSTPRQRRGSGRPLFAGIAIMAAAVVAVIVGLTLLRGQDGVGVEPSPSASLPGSAAESADASPPTTDPSATAIGTPQPEPTTAAGPPSISWDATQPFDGQPADVFVDGDRWVAGGWAVEGGPAAWTSADGREWTAATVPGPMPSELRGAGLGPIERVGDSLLSFGTFIGCCDGRGIHAWRSPDGEAWEIIESNSPLFEEGYMILEVVDGDPALVAVEGQYVDYAGRIWRWTPETSWVATTPGVTAGELSNLNARDVIWSSGRYVVVGERGDAMDGPVVPVAVAWISADGERWEEVAVDGGEGVSLQAVAALPGGRLVAYGSERNGNASAIPRVFVSDDGRSWSAVDRAFGDRVVNPRDLIAVDGGVLAVGIAESRTVLWWSADGMEWAQVGSVDQFYAAGAAAGRELVVFTSDGTGERFFITRGVLQP